MLAGKMPTKRTFGENDSDLKKSFITDDGDDNIGGEDGKESENGNESEIEQDPFDSVCEICDNGCELLCCGDICLRSLHATGRMRYLDATRRAVTFGFTRAQVEIVDKLQWYVQNGDTIVDFCCSGNDFSQFMKETLVAAGKKCSFKDYDIFPPRNDLNFERRDWLEVQQNELPTGSQLIIGLNPPFGDKASLANKYVDKALSFKPKLLILIVPQETERLDQKNPPYDLIWEDDGSLMRNAFDLPGPAVKQMEQRNQKPPLLYLWSRRDWTSKHKAIASEKGHTSEKCQESGEDESRVRKTMVEENVGKGQGQREDVTPEETNRNDNSNGVDSNKRSPLGSSNTSSPKKMKKEVASEESRTSRNGEGYDT